MLQVYNVESESESYYSQQKLIEKLGNATNFCFFLTATNYFMARAGSTLEVGFPDTDHRIKLKLKPQSVVFVGLAWRFIWCFEHSCKPENFF